MQGPEGDVPKSEEWCGSSQELHGPWLFGCSLDLAAHGSSASRAGSPHRAGVRIVHDECCPDRPTFSPPATGWRAIGFPGLCVSMTPIGGTRWPEQVDKASIKRASPASPVRSWPVAQAGLWTGLAGSLRSEWSDRAWRVHSGRFGAGGRCRFNRVGARYGVVLQPGMPNRRLDCEVGSAIGDLRANEARWSWLVV